MDLETACRVRSANCVQKFMVDWEDDLADAAFVLETVFAQAPGVIAVVAAEACDGIDPGVRVQQDRALGYGQPSDVTANR